MTGINAFRAGCIAIGLVALTGVGATILMPHQPTPTVQQAAETPACTSCDARHARLTKLRTTTAEKTE
jgi:hypothetical protein